jgi:PKD repeat protein
MAIVVTDAPPVAKASVNNENPFPGASVIFSAAGSHDVQGDIVSYNWNFGDGQSASGETAEHAYAAGGYYVVTLTVTDGAGNTDEATLSMNVLPGESRCTDSTTCGGGDPQPLAIITSKYFSCTSNGQVGDAIDLDGSASRGGVGNIVSYHWDFGDGTTGSGPTVTHVYNRAWTYIITLTVVDEAGGMNTATGTISIGGSCSGGTCGD